MSKYKPETTKLDTATVKAFVQSFLDGKLKVCTIEIFSIFLTEYQCSWEL
jgi:hypothetical protein